MKSNFLGRRFVLAVLSLLAGAVAHAYVLYHDDSDVYLIKWYTTPLVVQVKLPTTTNLSDGSSLSSSVFAAMEMWNAQLGAIRFSPVQSGSTLYALGNRINEIALDGMADGEAFPIGTLALTYNYFSGDEIVESDIIFNDAKYTWDSYRGPLRVNRTTQDIRRVAVHELGHVLGLDHPDEAGQTVTAIMESTVSSIETLQPDDIAGLQVLYGVPGVLPANDSFANATTITLTNGMATLTGSNIGATRETGEPAHGGATSTHSVWWQWTAPSDGTLTVDTLGSNFDTVLVAYTGSSVGALTQKAVNDDAESYEQNPTDQRKRTSKIIVTTVAGTTYRLAVAGWGDEYQVLEGYTGAITLNVSFAGQVSPTPVFSSHPQSQSIAAGGAISLSAAASASVAPSYQWQLNGRDLTGETAASLLLANLEPADAGIYTAVATNSNGTATSNPAIVGVTTSSKVIGAGEIVGTDIPHPNTNIFDQVLLTGAAEAITADPGQVTRTSFIDVDGDIVQVEFSGAGTLSLVLDSATGRAVAEKYNQPSVQYMTGHAGIVVTGANETTNLMVFSVGRQTAVNPDLFKSGVTYDGIADLAFIAITSTNGRFGLLRTANANYFAQRGYTGIYAPGVAFDGPVYVGDISAFDTAKPVFVLGSASDVRVTGGDMLQANGQPVQVSGITQLKFTAGSDSHGTALPAQTNRAVYQQDGVDVTSQIVVNP